MTGLILEVAELRPGVSEDDVHALIPAINSTRVYRMLVKDRGWSIARYERWMMEIAERSFFATDEGDPPA